METTIKSTKTTMQYLIKDYATKYFNKFKDKDFVSLNINGVDVSVFKHYTTSRTILVAKWETAVRNKIKEYTWSY